MIGSCLFLGKEKKNPEMKKVSGLRKDYYFNIDNTCTYDTHISNQQI